MECASTAASQHLRNCFHSIYFEFNQDEEIIFSDNELVSINSMGDISILLAVLTEQKKPLIYDM